MKKTVGIFSIVMVLIFSIASLCACNRAEQYFVFGTFLQVNASGKGCTNAPQKVYEYMEELENLLSPTIEGSDVYNVNHADVDAPVKCSESTMRIAKIAQTVYEMSDGAYDPSVYPLVRFYKMSGDLYLSSVLKNDFDFEKLPEALSVVGLLQAFAFDFENNTITKLIDGAMLDFGGIAKGYAADKARDLTDCKTLINLGGNVSAKNDTYSVGIANPDRADRKESETPYFAKLYLRDGECISTSGDYQRYYIYQNGEESKIYHHIIDPRTGLCANTGIASCSVISDNGALGDAVATAVVVLGVEEGERLLNNLGLKAVIIFADYTYKTVGNAEIELR